MQQYVLKGEPVVIRQAYNLSDEQLFKPESYLEEGKVPIYADYMRSRQYMTLDQYRQTFLDQIGTRYQLQNNDTHDADFSQSDDAEKDNGKQS